ncbi:hypothetical protein Tco_0608990, partial [Tanacetum coccineum]
AARYRQVKFLEFFDCPGPRQGVEDLRELFHKVNSQKVLRKDSLLEELPAAKVVAYDNVIRKKDFSALILCLGDWVLREITKEMTATGI